VGNSENDMQIEFGAVDHLDQQDRPHSDTYDDRLKLLQLYDEAGFFAYHLTEHHFTPLGLAPSPNLFLAAASRVTTRLRLATLVYVMTTYHPLRLAEEICMLDQLSHGRLEIGTGRGISPFEIGYFGIDHLESRAINREAWAVVEQALTTGHVDFDGKYFQCHDVPFTMKPAQLPHPPLWQAPGNAEGVVFCARNNISCAFNRPANITKPWTDLYKKVWTETHGGSGKKKMPKLAVGAHLFLDENEARAKERAQFGYDGWYRSFVHLWRRFVPMVPTLDVPGAGRQRLVMAGKPAQVRAEIEKLVGDCGANYFLARFAYGDLSYEESAGSLGLFVDEVMPHFAAATRAAE
jgi:alkanesulfonate monooxygenase SsuD/methylene tetrahydromethanopterin reductase-like flavin-dependent oxidoreductase (luciferase family)